MVHSQRNTYRMVMIVMCCSLLFYEYGSMVQQTWTEMVTIILHANPLLFAGGSLWFMIYRQRQKRSFGLTGSQINDQNMIRK